jgi:BirA family biotin operon repressor/biotin-[acetyl-CoA-carboxylase] ligase
MPDVSLHWGAEALWQRLLPLLPGLSVEVVERTSSTNTALLERARVMSRPDPEDADVLVQRSVESAAFGRRAADAQPCLLVAEHQTGGRGRQGRAWQSARGASLTFSLSLPLALPDWVALAEALDPLAPGAAPRIGLKWPNDLWLMDDFAPATRSGRKLGGVLIETVVAGSRRLAVIGIGLNVQPLGATETSSGFACLQELDPQASAPEVLARVALPLVEALMAFERQGFAPFATRFAARDLLAGQTVRTTQPDVAEGLAHGVDLRGALQVRTDRGEQLVTSGEVSVRLHPPSDPAC